MPSLASPSAQPTQGPAATGGPTIGGRYPDGLPSVVDGELVFRGEAALSHARAAVDDTPFLVAGWVTYEPGAVGYGCPWRSNDPSWLHACLGPAFSDVAGAVDATMARAITFRFALDGLATEPVVASVRVHDPRASTCGTDAAACDGMMVVQQVLWTGDAATTPQPLSLAAVMHALGGLEASPQLVTGNSGLAFPCADDLPSAEVYYLAAPERVWPLVTTIEIEPSAAARAQAVAAPPGASGALTHAALVETAFSSTPSGSWSEECRWLAVANVALVVRTHHGPTAADRLFISRLADALQQAAAGEGAGAAAGG